MEKGPGAGGEDDGGFEQTRSAGAFEADDHGGGRGAGRFWSARRVPAAILALVLLGASGLLLYDVASVRAGRQAMAWRKAIADKLAATSLDSAWVLAAGAVAVVLGLWLLVLALTPGTRRLLPLRGDSGGVVRAGLDRDAAALILRDRAQEVSGVQSVRVDVGRRKVRARAQAHFRDLDAVRADLDAALQNGIRSLGLARRLGLSVHVRRPKKR
ncbi:DUF6286 domain-containing protein [Streptomyces sp. HNM0574]|uniref:DUF6286 domain-containing protein n=1 Tax=Streptomyces sp. HNM0574 TaxID=2714954 RepID=UPI001F0D82FB|nr:DUF6286 domain-containing protein [Streptomyces sp. HNM0574]